MKCRECQHYKIYQMITSGPYPYGYAGDIPCVRCIHFEKNDEFAPPIESYNDQQAVDKAVEEAADVKKIADMLPMIAEPIQGRILQRDYATAEKISAHIKRAFGKECSRNVRTT